VASAATRFAGTSRRALDAELIHRSLAGDREAIRALHQHYYRIASSFLRKLGTRPSELEDACQEVFLQFFRYLSSFRGQAELKTWLYRLCVTEARRARRRRNVVAAVAALLRREPPQEAAPALMRSEATVQELAVRALDRMGPEHRTVFVLFEMEGMTGKEIAEITGSNQAATFRRLYEARRMFRKTLGMDPAVDGEGPGAAESETEAEAGVGGAKGK
jgi:RNA polymerase sigma-70 factor (ECF subfamily)